MVTPIHIRSSYDPNTCIPSLCEYTRVDWKYCEDDVKSISQYPSSSVIDLVWLVYALMSLLCVFVNSCVLIVHVTFYVITPILRSTYEKHSSIFMPNHELIGPVVHGSWVALQQVITYSYTILCTRVRSLILGKRFTTVMNGLLWSANIPETHARIKCGLSMHTDDLSFTVERCSLSIYILTS